VMLILIGAALALFVALILIHPADSSTPPPASTESLIPAKIEGFVIDQIERVSPIFEGELFSVHASLRPETGSLYEVAVENLGITLFLLRTPRAAEEIRPLLLFGESRPITFEGVRMDAFADGNTRLAGLIWQEGLTLYYVLVSGVADVFELDMSLLEQAAQTAARAILKQAEP
jgi:hypothetical protein